MPANVTTRVDTRANESQRVDIRPSESAVQIQDRGANQAVEVQPAQRTEVREAPVQQATQAPRQSGGGDMYLAQAASRDLGSLAQPRTQAQAQTQQRTVMGPTVAQASGMEPIPRQAPASRGVPVIDASSVGNLQAMSSRPGGYSPSTVDVVLSGAALGEARMEGREDDLNDRNVVPSMTAMKTMDAARMTRRENAASTSQETMEQRSQQSAAQATDASTRATSVREVEDNKPNSIFNRSFGYSGKSREARTKQASLKRPSSIINAVKDRAARAFKRSGVGVRVYGKMLALPSLDFREVGLGVQEIVAAVDQDPGMVNRLLGEDVSMWSASELTHFINSHEIYVGTFKPPNNRGQDVQRRRLRILTSQRRGIYLHPIMAAMYTADFDGDDMEVSLDPEVAELARDPMDYMVGIDGKQSLNVDFLPVVKIIGKYAEGKNERDFVKEVMFSWLFGADGKPIFSGLDGRTISPLVDAVLKLSDSAVGGDSDAQAIEWGNVFQKARQVADVYSNGNKSRSDSMTSRLCQSVYNGMRAIKYYNTLTVIGADTNDMPTPRTYDDSAIYRIIDESMQEGSVPNNFQDLKLMLSGFLGNVKGKNAPFRFSADVGKMMKMDSRLQIGDEFVVDPNNREQMQMFFESTVKFMESRRMAREVKVAGRSQYYTQLMRDRVIKEVGFPESYANYSDFLTAFYVSYNRNSSIINEANLVFMANMGISFGSNRGLVSPLNPSRGGVTLGDIAEPLLSVYGTYSVGRMFQSLSTSGVMGEHVDPRWKGTPGHVTKLRERGQDASKPIEREYERSSSEFWVTGKYLSYSLRKFKNENRLTRGSGNSGSRRVSDLTKVDNVSAEFDMLMAIADKRTSTASMFNKNVYGTMEGEHVSGEGTTVQMLSDLLSELNRLDTDGTVSGRRDQMLWVNDIVDVLIASGPDMFSHFDMDSTAGFLQSKWAKKMIEHANDPEVLGGIRTAMVFDYRMERIIDLTSDVINPNRDIDQWVSDISNLQLAKDELASASEVWHGILKEFEAEATSGQESVFQMMRNGMLMQTSSPSGEAYAWDVEYDARGFWANPGSHTSLRSVIEDLDMDRATKWNVITDVVRYWEHDAYLKSYEVGYQLEIGNDSTYDLRSGSTQSALGVHRDFEQSFNRWGKMCQEKLQEDVDKAFEAHGDKPGHLTKTLQRLDSSPWELIGVDDMMYADSILSVMDKTYAQTEKASQHPWTNAIYAALSFQRNGGYMNDITRTDDRMLGIQSVSSIGIQEVIHLLADPDAMIEAYNEYGEVGILTRESLLQNALGRELSADVESDIWEFLRQEPRIASAIRRHSACVVSDTDGSGYLGASLGIDETITNSNTMMSNPVDHVRYLMRDHPVYAAIISLAIPARGSVTRNARQRIAAMERYFSSQIYAHASNRDMDSDQAAREILDDLGITLDSLKSALRSNYDVFLEMQGLPTTYDSGESDSDAEYTYEIVSTSLIGYINDVRREVRLGAFHPAAQRPMRVGVDVTSVASFWDVVQELSGAKTSVSTGVEGAETYQFAEWASHITARDRYADLEAVPDEDVDAGWDGMWTNLRNEDGSPMLLRVDEDGSIANYDELIDAKQQQGMDEIVTMVPDGYEVKDRSTDSHGNQVASLFAYMVSKRSNGAEAFNLKAKKSGIDGKDSITKMNGKYYMVSYEGQERRASFMETEHRLRQLAQQNGENGLMVAKAELAMIMMQGNNDLGYDDMTMANYMSIADLMLIQDVEGEIHLRSLEMLFSAIKYRLGPSVDEMTDAEIREAADAIVNDNTETGVGIAQMASPLEVLDGIRPKSKSVSTTGIRQNSSVFERNYDLLSEITESAGNEGIGPMSPNKAKQLTERYSRIPGVKDVINGLDVVRNYSIVGHVGASVDEHIDWTIGPSNAIVIGNGDVSDARVAQICDRAYELGMTVIVGAVNRNKIPTRFVADAMPCSDSGDVIVPCFDMRLNGSEATPYNGGRFAIFQAPFSRYVVSVEDSVNEFALGDAQARPTKSLTDRTRIVENGSKRITAEELFPNVFRNPAFRHSLTSVSMASGSEIAQLITDGVRCTIDYGVVEGGRGFEQRKHDVDAAIERYQQRWPEADPDGVIRGGMTECAPGDIVGWAECEIRDQFTDEVQYVLAPIIPFPLHGPTKGIPEKFSVEQLVTVDNDNTIFSLDWTNTTEIANSFAKYFDSSGGANKGMMDFADTIDDQRLLRDGTAVDVYIAKASTDSRKIGTDRRIKTMISLMALARMHGYNFAKSDGAFPDDPELRERMLSKRIPASEWKQMLQSDQYLFMFTTDERLNAFLNYECRKILIDGGNPSDYLANVYTDANGVEHNTHVMWEFEAMFDQGLNYEDGLLRFLHTMDPTFCPSGIDDPGSYTFRLAHDGEGLAQDYDSGVLQMQVPHRMSDGSMSYLWDNVYIGMSFFGEDYSGFSRPNVDGASNFLDAMNTMSYYGAQLDEPSARFRAMWASADLGRLPRDGGAIGKVDTRQEANKTLKSTRRVEGNNENAAHSNSVVGNEENLDRLYEERWNLIHEYVSKHSIKPGETLSSSKEQYLLDNLKKLWLDWIDICNAIGEDVTNSDGEWEACLSELGLIPADWKNNPEFISSDYDGTYGSVGRDDFALPTRLLPPWGNTGYWKVNS